MEMTSNWRSSTDLAAEARLKNSRPWERASEIIDIHATYAAVIYIEQRRLSCFVEITPCCVRAQLI